jgi:hypothetical protein
MQDVAVVRVPLQPHLVGGVTAAFEGAGMLGRVGDGIELAAKFGKQPIA